MERDIILPLTEEELSERTEKNYNRLLAPYYGIDEVFAPAEYDWPGDKEGRALLAFACHARLSGKINPCMPLMRERLDSKTGGRGYFGPLSTETVFEQQLSGHSWYLRALCAVYRLDGDAEDIRRMRQVFEGLYLPTAGRFSGYPVDRADSDGGVSGHSGTVMNGWRLSSDIGCAFMSIDGLSDYYELTRDGRALSLLDEMISVFVKVDKVKLKAQTHCSLTAARGMLRLYRITGEQRYLRGARGIWQTYTEQGMTGTYQNFNWWGKGDTWTEPCAIVDSLMVALQLYDICGDEQALTLARRIWHNGMASAQRPNGGAGTDSTVSRSCDALSAQMYEAYFCCTMRLAEGLLCAKEHKELLSARLRGKLEKSADGIYHDGDIVYAEILKDGTCEASQIPELGEAKEIDGHILTPLVKYYRIPENLVPVIKQKVRFE